jgi:hypothetical protein
MSPDLRPWNGRVSTLLTKEVIECMGRARHYAMNKQVKRLFSRTPTPPEVTMYNNMSHLIPDAKNLWDTLFTTPVNLNDTVLEYVNSFGMMVTAEELDSLCEQEKQSINIMPQFAGGNKVMKKASKQEAASKKKARSKLVN